MYNEVIVKRVLNLGHTITYKVLDRGMIEEIGPTGIIRVVGELGRIASGKQTGQIGQYSLVMIVGTVVIIVLSSFV